VVYGAVLPLAGVVLITLGGINLMLALFNLIPCFPMDGGRVLRALASRRMGILRATRLAMQIGNGVAILMASYALYKGLPMLLFIAIFIFFAARSEYRAVVQREQLRRMAPAWAGFWPVQPLPDEQVEAIEVGPPPFR